MRNFLFFFKGGERARRSVVEFCFLRAASACTAAALFFYSPECGTSFSLSVGKARVDQRDYTAGNEGMRNRFNAADLFFSSSCRGVGSRCQKSMFLKREREVERGGGGGCSCERPLELSVFFLLLTVA